MFYYTNAPRDDGFGGQVQNILWDMLYVREQLKQPFAMTIPQKMEHNYKQAPNFIENLIHFMNLDTFLPVIPPDYTQKQYIQNSEVYPAIEYKIDFFNESDTMNQYREAFYKDKQSPYDSTFFNIAVHIRRNNPHDHYEVFISMNRHIKQIEKIRSLFKEKNYKIHIYSQGNEVVDVFHGDDIIFHLDEPIQETFLGFIFADVLCIDSSSFSYLAGLIRTKDVYYFPLAHRTPYYWISMED
jgi:hypothetical protein